MTMFGNLFGSGFDFSTGKLPPWIDQFVAVTRPLAVNAMIAIPTLGAFSVGLVALFDYQRAIHMAAASTAFLKGIPDAAYGAIVAVALGYTAAKATEAIKGPAPVGGSDPEVPGSVGEGAPPPPPPPSPPVIDLSKE